MISPKDILDNIFLMENPHFAICHPDKAYEVFRSMPNLTVAVFSLEDPGTTCYMYDPVWLLDLPPKKLKEKLAMV